MWNFGCLSTTKEIVSDQVINLMATQLKDVLAVSGVGNSLSNRMSSEVSGELLPHHFNK